MKVMTVSPLLPALLPQGGEGRFVSRVRDFHIRAARRTAARPSWRSMEIATGGRQATEERRQVDEPFGHQMDDLTFALYLPENAEQTGTEQFVALLLDQSRVHDDIGQPGFIFQGDKNDSAGRARPLPTGDDSGGSSELAVGRVLQLAGGNETLCTESATQ